MSMFWIGFVCGVWLGGTLGFLLAAILAAAKRTDREMGIDG